VTQDSLKPTLVNALKIPVETITLPNGLKVVVAPDTTAPVVTVGVYYKIGFRLEPQGRSGFAHLFEHMMFQGSANAPKMQHIKLINSAAAPLTVPRITMSPIISSPFPPTRWSASCGLKPIACAPSKSMTKIFATSAMS